MFDYKDKSYEGSAVFFRGDSPVSWLIRIGGFLNPKYGYSLSNFSHVETIFFNDQKGELYTITATQPAVRIKPLREVMNERPKEYKEILKLDAFGQSNIRILRTLFLNCVKENIGTPYGYFSALSSEVDLAKDGTWLNKVFNRHKPKKQIHCSALDAKLMQSVGIFSDKISPLEYTPDDCYYERKLLDSVPVKV